MMVKGLRFVGFGFGDSRLEFLGMVADCSNDFRDKFVRLGSGLQAAGLGFIAGFWNGVLQNQARTPTSLTNLESLVGQPSTPTGHHLAASTDHTINPTP